MWEPTAVFVVLSLTLLLFLAYRHSLVSPLTPPSAQNLATVYMRLEENAESSSMQQNDASWVGLDQICLTGAGGMQHCAKKIKKKIQQIPFLGLYE